MRVPCWMLTALALGCAGPLCAQKGAPTVETAKQALDRKWQKLKPDHVAQRTVLFQEVTPGQAQAGSYPFRVTVGKLAAGLRAHRDVDSITNPIRGVAHFVELLLGRVRGAD